MQRLFFMLTFVYLVCVTALVFAVVATISVAFLWTMCHFAFRMI